jgi:hypothetical protein
MSSLKAAPFLLYILVGILLGLLAWGFMMSRSRSSRGIWPDTPDYLRLWLLLLAFFSLGVFVAYTLEALFLFK